MGSELDQFRCGTCECGRTMYRTQAKGPPTKACLACKRKKSQNWKRDLIRFRPLLSEEAYVEYCNSQDVPVLLDDTTGVAPPKVSDPDNIDYLAFAAALHVCDSAAEAAKLAGLKMQGKALEKAAKKARSTYRGVTEGSQGELARLAYSTMVMALARLRSSIAEVSPGALAQLIQSLHKVWAPIAGMGHVGDIQVVFPDLTLTAKEQAQEQARSASKH